PFGLETGPPPSPLGRRRAGGGQGRCGRAHARSTHPRLSLGMPPRSQRSPWNPPEGALQHAEDEEAAAQSSGNRDDVEETRPQVGMDMQDTCPELADQDRAVPSPSQAGSDALLEDGAGREVVSSDARRVMGAAATVASAAGMALAGPVSGAALGAAAMYAATREGSTGKVARKVGSTFLTVTDRAVDAGLLAADAGAQMVGAAVEKGCQKISRDVDLATMPAPVRLGVRALLSSQAQPVRSPQASSKEAANYRQRYPDRVPVICERSPYSTGIPEMKKKKFIVPGSMLCGEFKYIIHKNLSQALAGHRGAEQTIYIFLNGLAPKTSAPMSELYERFRADDGFLYIKYGAESTLG
ncbi:unnamed protein product, partial [Prorocentrum cordatum]